jgi:predicted amidohydrolase YtcJ
MATFGLKGLILKKFKLFYNARVYTQTGEPGVDSFAVDGNIIAAVGRGLEKDADFSNYEKYNLEGKTVIPGFTDSHTHIYFLIISIGRVKLDGAGSVEEVLARIKRHSSRLGKDDWITGDGFSPDRWKKYVMPDKYMLDKAAGGRPAAIFSKDQHMMWVNSRALEMAGINKNTPNPEGGAIERFMDGEPSGILKELPGYFPVIKIYGRSDQEKAFKLHRVALRDLYSRGVTGVHSFDGPEAFDFFLRLSREGKLGLRVNYYPPAKIIPELKEKGVAYGFGNEYFRVSGVKLFADGSLGSQSAYCFRKYIGSRNNFGIEAASREEILKAIISASKLNLPCAIHALGDRAISNVLDCFEKSPALLYGARHRIEHLQLIRRPDIKRLAKLGVTASMQPSHCPSDVKLIQKYWGQRGKDCFIFKTLLRNKILLAFGSDAPIEPLDPLSGVNAAVNRPIPDSKKSFYPRERISPAEAVFGFTAGSALAVGQAQERGFILPGYKADFVILSRDIYQIKTEEIAGTEILATYFDGSLVFKNRICSLAI